MDDVVQPIPGQMVVDDVICVCENEHRGLFVWRGDPRWWSCMQCDGRVRPLTAEELRDRTGIELSRNPCHEDQV